PTAPGGTMDGAWRLNANASDDDGGYCILSARVTVEGTADAFTGTGDMAVTRSAAGFQVVPVTIEGDRQEVRIGGYVLSVDRSPSDLVSGTWSCDGGAGTWTLWRAE